MKAVLLSRDPTDFVQLQRSFISIGWELSHLSPDAPAPSQATDGKRDSPLEVLLRDIRGRRDIILLVDAESDATWAPSIVRALRRNQVQNPIGLLVPPLENGRARAAIANALRAGADDFLAREGDPEELALRLGAMLERRRPSDLNSAVHIGDLQIARASRVLSCNGLAVTLTAYEYRTFQQLARHSDTPVSRQQLLGRPQSGEQGAHSNLVDVYVLYLRRKLARLGSRCAIKTVRGVGYMLVAPNSNERPGDTAPDTKEVEYLRMRDE